MNNNDGSYFPRGRSSSRGQSPPRSSRSPPFRGGQSPRRSRSPPFRRSRSPPFRRSRSPQFRRSRSPPFRRSRSPPFRRSRSPPFRRSRSPSFKRSRSPPYRSRSPGRSRSPPRRRFGGRSRYDDSPPRYRRSRSPPMRRMRRRTDEPPEPSNVLAVFGLHEDTDESALEEEFSKFAPVESVNLIRDKRSNISKKFAFINFGSIEDATKAKEESAQLIIHGKEVRIDFSATTRAHEPTPGRYMGRRSPRRRSPRRSYHPYGRRSRSRGRDY